MVLELIFDPMWEFVWPVRGVCLYDPTIPWDTTRTLCLHGVGGRGCVCDVPHQIREKVHSAIYVETLAF